MRERALTSAPRLIVFDCDGVLVDSELLSMRAYIDILADIGVEVRERHRHVNELGVGERLNADHVDFP